VASFAAVTTSYATPKTVVEVLVANAERLADV
jgi:hypothetical protein